MNRSGFFVAGLFVGVALTFVGLKYHVVRASDGVHLVPKLTADFREPYMDIREFGLSDWNNHRTLAAAIMRSNKSQIMQSNALDGISSSVGRTVNEWAPSK